MYTSHLWMQNLYNNKNAVDITIPATVEEYMWGKNGNTHGICGNYCGVSWFTTGVSVPADWKGKRITIDFESARMRAEVYLNDKLVGYELINGTPFSIDITDDVKVGSHNRLAVRITDPNGNFAWRDWDSFMWGKYEIPPSHGFGGITGKVSLHATSHSYIDDIFIKNTPDLNRVNVMTTLENKGDLCNGVIEYSIKEYGSDKLVWKGKTVVPSLSKKISVEKNIEVKNVKLWSPDSPNLYVLTAKWMNDKEEKHVKTERFGFRWFDVKTVNGDRMFMLNGKRIVLHTAISWGIGRLMEFILLRNWPESISCLPNSWV